MGSGVDGSTGWSITSAGAAWFIICGGGSAGSSNSTCVALGNRRIGDAAVVASMRAAGRNSLSRLFRIRVWLSCDRRVTTSTTSSAVMSRLLCGKGIHCSAPPSLKGGVASLGGFAANSTGTSSTGSQDAEVAAKSSLTSHSVCVVELCRVARMGFAGGSLSGFAVVSNKRRAHCTELSVLEPGKARQRAS